MIAAECLGQGYGSSTALRTFVHAALAHSSWQITIVAPRSRDADERWPDPRLTIVPIDTYGKGRRAQLLRFTADCMSRAWTDIEPDVIISWQPLPSAAVGHVIARKLRVPHIVRTCGPELAHAWSRFPYVTATLGPLTRYLLRGADAVVIKSELERTLLGDSVPAERIRLIPNAVDRKFFVNPRVPGDDCLRLLSVCQLETHKNVDQLIDAVRAVNDTEDAKCSLTIAGDGSQRARLHRAARASNGAVRLLGRVAHHSLPTLYSAHDAFILGSPMEGCSNAVLEAMAAQLPILGTRTALGDLVRDGSNGVLACRPDSIETALRRFVAMEAQRPAMRAAALLAAGEYAPDRLLSAYSALLDDIC